MLEPLGGGDGVAPVVIVLAVANEGQSGNDKDHYPSGGPLLVFGVSHRS